MSDENAKNSINMKENIVRAFFELSKTKNIDKITVKDIVTECGISRQTFYYHFQDMLDVSEWSLRQEMNRMLELSRAAGTPTDAIRIFTHKLLENKAIIRKLHSSERREQLEKIVIRTSRDYIRELMLEKGGDVRLSHRDFEFLLDFYSLGLTEYMIIHIDDNLDEDVLASQVFRMLSGQIPLISQLS